MTEKEAKAIETFKHWIEYEKANKEKINKADELIEIQETVLKALEQKDKEISELKEKYDRDTHILQSQLDVANADRVEKDKIIDEMTKYIESKELLIDKQFNILTANCIKQYFEKKVSDRE